MSTVTSAEPLHVEWLAHWDAHTGPRRQEPYVREELARLAEAGQPLLYAALTAPLLDQTDLALKVLRELQSTCWLRLAEGATPPPLDPQGRELPEADRGRVLVVAVGERGQMPVGEVLANPALATPYTGPNRRALAASRQGLYRTARLTREPLSLPLEDAIVALRAWGHGVVNEEQRFRPRTERRYLPDEKTGMEQLYERVVRQDRWLLVEVPQRDGRPLAADPPPAPPPPAPRHPRAAAPT